MHATKGYPMYLIEKTFKFDAAHRLSGLPVEHKCGRLHGHTYHVTVRLSAVELSAPGFVVDYATLDDFKKYLDAQFDHRYLNEVLNANPTAELLAKHFYDYLVKYYAEYNNVLVKS